MKRLQLGEMKLLQVGVMKHIHLQNADMTKAGRRMKLLQPGK